MMEIRRLPSSRWKEYRQLRLESLRGSPLAFGSALEEEKGLEEVEWKKRMKTTRFAMAGDTPVGMIACAFNKDVKFRHIAEIFGFYVRASYRGKGMGSALLQRALLMAEKNSGIVKVRLYVNGQQRSALRIYKRSGFVAVGRLAREMKVGGKFYTMLIMEKRVR